MLHKVQYIIVSLAILAGACSYEADKKCQKQWELSGAEGPITYEFALGCCEVAKRAYSDQKFSECMMYVWKYSTK